MTEQKSNRWDLALAWYFVLIWGSGYLASKAGMQYAPPFTFLSLRYLVGILFLVPWILIARPVWPRTGQEWFHICIAGLLMHAVNLGGSHYSQYLGMSAGITALLLATQPLFTALIANRMMGERLRPVQWAGMALGLAGVLLVVWHKVNIQAVTLPSLIAVGTSLTAITAGTLYQRVYCRHVDLRSSALIQFMLSLAVLAPLGWVIEGFTIRWSVTLIVSVLFLVIFASILAVNALHMLMRHGSATKVTSLFFLTPLIAVGLEWMLFGVVPTPISLVGIAVTCAGVALVSRPQA